MRMLTRYFHVLAATLATAAPLLLATASAQTSSLRPPSVPLVACDPYFSIWSPADNLTGADTTHWTGKPHRLWSVARIDGKEYRVLGSGPASEQILAQKTLTVLPTRTIYAFEGAGVALTLTFLTPALPEDIEILSRPVTYVSYEFRSLDGKSHSVGFSLVASGEIAVNEPAQTVVVSLPKSYRSLRVARVGSREQPILGKRGDDLRIDWGYLYLAAAADQMAKPATSPQIASGGEADARGDAASISLQFADVKVASKPVTRWLMLAYDDLYSIQYMKKNLRPYWRRNGWEANDLLQASARDYEKLLKRCVKFDEELMADLTRAGGEKYARICALAFRQCFAAGKFVADDNGQPIQFCKENHSNGCIGTSDVFYPMSPQFLLFGPSLAKSFLVPFMEYAASPRWKFPFAPHDLGTYPKANGQVYGGGERTEENQMPVEESGNLLILMGAIAEMEGNPGFASAYWPTLEKWAAYLKDKGFDPENQLCTDDFAGHLAHNVNLSAKAICALGSFAKLCEMRGDKAKADEYFKLAREFAQRWVKEAQDGEKYRLAFDKPGSWSQKYNLIWDRILGLKLFPAEVLRQEMDYYKKIQNKYGIPLDNRKDYTKLDWILWTATLTQERADFEALVDPVYRFLQETPDRSPMTDWYQTKDAKKVGFTARPVVGGVFAQMLYDKAVWQKYARRDETKARRWAKMPEAPKVSVVIPAADKEPAIWRYTTTKPAADWFSPTFNAESWSEGKSGFGTRGTPGSTIGTVWNTRDIWLRREIELTPGQIRDAQAWLHHDEDVEVYINGALAITSAGWASDYEAVPLTAAGQKALKAGKNVIAIHCRQNNGGQYIDFGLVGVSAK
jgi:hypothetical protein